MFLTTPSRTSPSFRPCDQLGALLGAGLFQHGAARDDDVAAAAVHLEDRERLRRAHQRADVAHRADVDLAARQEGHGAAEVDGEAALHAAEDRALDALLRLERLLEVGPGLLAAGLLARQDDRAVLVLDALEEDLDDVAGLDLGLAARRARIPSARRGLRSSGRHRRWRIRRSRRTTRPLTTEPSKPESAPRDSSSSAAKSSASRNGPASGRGGPVRASVRTGRNDAMWWSCAPLRVPRRGPDRGRLGLARSAVTASGPRPGARRRIGPPCTGLRISQPPHAALWRQGNPGAATWAVRVQSASLVRAEVRQARSPPRSRRAHCRQAAAKAASASRLVVSSTMASAAGCTALSARRVRSSRAASRPPPSPGPRRCPWPAAPASGAAPARPRGGDEQLHRRVGEDHGADVAPVQHRAACAVPKARWKSSSAARTAGMAATDAAAASACGSTQVAASRSAGRSARAAASAASGRRDRRPRPARGARPPDTAARCRDGQARASRPGAAPACPSRQRPARRWR